MLFAVLMFVGMGCQSPPSSWAPPRFECPSMEDELWLREQTPGPQVDPVSNERGRRFVHAAAYCRNAEKGIP